MLFWFAACRFTDFMVSIIIIEPFIFQVDMDMDVIHIIDRTMDDCPNIDASMPTPTPTIGTFTPRPTSTTTSSVSSRVPKPSQSKKEHDEDRPPQPNKRIGLETI